MELIELNTSFLHIHRDRCSKALFVKTQHYLKNSCMQTSTWPACEMRSLLLYKRIAPAGCCLPLGLHFHFPSLSHLPALVAALQQPRQTPDWRERGAAWLSPAEDSRQAGPGRSRCHSCPLLERLFSAQSQNAWELSDVWSLFAMPMHTAHAVSSLLTWFLSTLEHCQK